MKGCCFIKFRDDAIFPVFPSISFLPLFLKAIVLTFIPGLSYVAQLCGGGKKNNNKKETNLLLRTEEKKDGLKELNF